MQDVASKNAYFFRTRSEDKSNLLNRPDTFNFINLLTDKIYFKTKKSTKTEIFVDSLARLKGLEPLTYWFVASHSIQLSYKRISQTASSL